MQQSARQTCPPLLSPAKLSGILRFGLLEIEQLAQILGATFEFIVCHSVHQGVEMHVLIDCEFRVESDFLRHVAHIVSRHFALWAGSGCLAEDHHRALTGSQVGKKDFDQGRFAWGHKNEAEQTSMRVSDGCSAVVLRSAAASKLP